MKTTVVIYAYNEVNFIRKTLDSVIDEADEIIISEGESTDGTSDIIGHYASTYPKIIYKRSGAQTAERAKWVLANLTGDYVYYTGAHDMISKGAISSMVAVAVQHSASLVYPKQCILINPDYSILSTNTFDIPGVVSESPYERVASLARKLSDCSILMGLYPVAVYKGMYIPRLYEEIQTDHYLLAYAASRGKIVADANSTFYRMMPRQEEEWVESCRRATRCFGDYNPYLWPFLIMAEQYDLAKEMESWQGAPKNYAKQILAILVPSFGRPRGFNVSLDKFPKPLPNARPIIDEVYQAASKLKRRDYARLVVYNYLKHRNSNGSLFRHLQSKLKRKGIIQ